MLGMKPKKVGGGSKAGSVRKGTNTGPQGREISDKSANRSETVKLMLSSCMKSIRNLLSRNTGVNQAQRDLKAKVAESMPKKIDGQLEYATKLTSTEINELMELVSERFENDPSFDKILDSLNELYQEKRYGIGDKEGDISKLPTNEGKQNNETIGIKNDAVRKINMVLLDGIEDKKRADYIASFNQNPEGYIADIEKDLQRVKKDSKDESSDYFKLTKPGERERNLGIIEEGIDKLKNSNSNSASQFIIMLSLLAAS